MACVQPVQQASNELLSSVQHTTPTTMRPRHVRSLEPFIGPLTRAQHRRQQRRRNWAEYKHRCIPASDAVDPGDQPKFLDLSLLDVQNILRNANKELLFNRNPRTQTRYKNDVQQLRRWIMRHARIPADTSASTSSSSAQASTRVDNSENAINTTCASNSTSDTHTVRASESTRITPTECSSDSTSVVHNIMPLYSMSSPSIASTSYDYYAPHIFHPSEFPPLASPTVQTHTSSVWNHTSETPSVPHWSDTSNFPSLPSASATPSFSHRPLLTNTNEATAQVSTLERPRTPVSRVLETIPDYLPPEHYLHQFMVACEAKNFDLTPPKLKQFTYQCVLCWKQLTTPIQLTCGHFADKLCYVTMHPLPNLCPICSKDITYGCQIVPTQTPHHPEYIICDYLFRLQMSPSILYRMVKTPGVYSRAWAAQFKANVLQLHAIYRKEWILRLDFVGQQLSGLLNTHLELYNRGLRYRSNRWTTPHAHVVVNNLDGYPRDTRSCPLQYLPRHRPLTPPLITID
jgi:hypothetical protein